MSSIGSLLNTARNAMAAHQTAILVTSNNVANAEVDGYSRQIAPLETAPATPESGGSIGSGVRTRDVRRVRDELLDAAFRRDSAAAAAHGRREELLDAVQDVFGPLATGGVDEDLDAFWNAWSDLANQPGSATARRLVRMSGERVATSLHGAAERLDEVGRTTGERLERDVAALNALAKQAAGLNREITLGEASGQSAPALRDERDRALDAMAKLAAIQVIGRDDGTAAVVLDGASLVDGDVVRTLEVRGSARATLGLAGSAATVAVPGGPIGEQLAVLNDTVPETRARLDAFARGLVASTNAVHRLGTARLADGTLASGTDFFQLPAERLDGVTAATVRVSDAVRADVSAIAAGYDAAGGTGDNRLALDLAALRGRAVTLTVARGDTAESAAMTLGEFHAQTVTALGELARDAGQSASVHATLAAQADNRRLAVSGVSTDEELAQLVRQQQAYAAAARLVSVADEMARAILELGR